MHQVNRCYRYTQISDTCQSCQLFDVERCFGRPAANCGNRWHLERRKWRVSEVWTDCLKRSAAHGVPKVFIMSLTCQDWSWQIGVLMGALGANSRMSQSICVSSSQTSGILAGGYAWYAAWRSSHRWEVTQSGSCHSLVRQFFWDIAVSQILGLEAQLGSGYSLIDCWPYSWHISSHPVQYPKIHSVDPTNWKHWAPLHVLTCSWTF